jgi:type IV secretion system protein VirD4
MFTMPQIKRLIDHDSVELDKIALRETILYINITDYDTTFNFLATIMFSMLNLTLFHQADVLYDGEVPVPVSIWADEYANYSNIYRMENFTAVNRSRNISMNLLLQDINQLKKKHEKDWKTIVSNSDTLIFLGGYEEDTTKLISEMAGDGTIYEKDYERDKSGKRILKPKAMLRKVYKPDEVAKLDNEKALIFIRGMNAVEDTKFIAENHPNWKYFAPPKSPDNPKWYTWKRYENKVDEWLDNTTQIIDLNAEDDENEFVEMTAS